MGKLFAGLTAKGLKVKASGETYRTIGQHYSRKEYIPSQKEFVKNTRAKVFRSNILANKGWVKGDFTNYKSPNERQFHAEHWDALKNINRFGGYAWTPAQKIAAGKNIQNIGVAERQVNIAKGAKGIDKWLPPKNIKRFLRGIEKNRKDNKLLMSKEESTVFEKEMGRKPNVKIGLPVEKTKYCTTCHINHSIGKHR